MNKDPSNSICKRSGCNLPATTSVAIQLTDDEICSVSLCERCKIEFFPGCVDVWEYGKNGQLFVPNNKIPLDFDLKTKCLCHDCPNEAASVFLEIVRLPRPGYYCEHCAIDMKLHGFAEEVTFE